MVATEFLIHEKGKWNVIDDSLLVNCTDQEKSVIRELETTILVGELSAVDNIICNCKNRFQFAKTYKVLRDDFEKTISNSYNPNFPKPFNDAFKLALSNVAKLKLGALARWFFCTFVDSSDMRQFEATPNAI